MQRHWWAGALGDVSRAYTGAVVVRAASSESRMVRWRYIFSCSADEGSSRSLLEERLGLAGGGAGSARVGGPRALSRVRGGVLRCLH